MSDERTLGGAVTMEAFSKLGTLLMNALETRQPTVDLLQSFVDNWKSVTNYYIVTTDDERPVKQTDIPWHLKQMLDILVYEEKQQGAEETGVCLEYLLQHKLLETLCTLGKAQYPPGMVQQVLLFFWKLLSQMSKPLLHLVNVYRPVQKLIGLCGLPGSDTEKEEAQFLLVVCSCVKQEPNLLRLVLEPADQTAAAARPHPSDSPANHTSETSPQSSQPQCSAVQPESALLSALFQLTRSQRSSVCLKAYESLLLLACLQGELQSLQLQLAVLLAGRLQELHLLLPLECLEAGQLQSWPATPWSSQFSRCGADLSSEAPAHGHMTRFFSWFDFLDHLMTEAPEVFALQLAQCVHQAWLLDVLLSQLQDTCEQVLLLSTTVLCAAVRLVRSSCFLDQLVHFLLKTPPTAELLLQRCNHISDQISLVSLSLLDELLQKPHRDVVQVLVLRYLDGRSYLDGHAHLHGHAHLDGHSYPPGAGQEDRLTESPYDSDGLEEDPFFSDSLLPTPPSSCSAPPLPLLGSADAVNSFLCLVPVQVRSAQLLQEGGYESYIHDAHSLVTQCQSLSASWEWPVTPPPPPASSTAEGEGEEGEGEEFSEGPLLRVLLDRLGRVLEQPYELNLQLTAVLSRLSAFSHPLLHEYLLDPYIPLSPCCRSLFSVLVRLMADLVQRIQQVPNLTDKLVKARRHLLGLDQSTGMEHLTLLRGIIVLEEFCKELAAIAFVTLPLEQQ